MKEFYIEKHLMDLLLKRFNNLENVIQVKLISDLQLLVSQESS